MALERATRSWEARMGKCARWLNEDTVCSLWPGHLAGDIPHRGYDPSGSGSWIDVDDEGNVIARGNVWDRP